MSPLQQATQFFYDQIGHKIIASAPTPSFAIAQEGECAICGRHGHGFFDDRKNHQAFRCTQCWSFYWPAPDVFPRTGTEKDFSFAGKVKNAWVLDASGTLYSPVGEATNKDEAFRAAAARFGIDFSPQNLPPERWLMRQAFSGRFGFPLLWSSFGQNKVRSIQAMRLAQTPVVIPRAIDGETVWYDGAAIAQASEAIAEMDEEQRKALKSTRWLFDGLPTEVSKRLRVRRVLGEIGIPKAALGMSDDSRGIVSRLAA